jgi:hypothetical protein
MFLILTLLALGNAGFAQCPTGAMCNTGGTVNNGQTLYITTQVNAALTLKNGSKMIIQSGGKFSGNINANNGSEITVETGGEFAPGTANSFSAVITNDGKVIFASGSNFGTNFGLTNNTGTANFRGSFNDNGKIWINNSPCGTVTFENNLSIQSKNSQVLNNGLFVVRGSLTTSQNTTIENSGKFYTEGSFNSAGLIFNRNYMVFKGGSNNLNSGDSIVNLNILVFHNSVLGGRAIRNEGLLWIASGSFQFNNGTVRQNNPDALFRLDGHLMNNGNINGTGNFSVLQTIQNNGTVAGISAAKKLKINKTVPSGSTNFLDVSSVTLFDTLNYSGIYKNAPVCQMSTLPITISDLSGVHVGSDNKISWTSSLESNALGYEIQHSENGTHFSTIGKIEAKGTASSYQYLHLSVANGTHYYRIKMVDKDGSSKMSKVIVLKNATQGSATEMFTVAGNPFRERVSLMIQSDKNEQVMIRLMDQSGKVVKQKMILLEKGMNNVSVDQLTSIPTGTYFLGMIKDGKMKSVKVVKS